jgi:DNA polymerase-3 subunit alpha
MKTYHPVEYMAALLTFEMGDTKQIEDYLEECRQLSIQVQPPDVNASDKDFTPVYAAESKRKAKTSIIRFGLMAVKGVGQKAVESIIAERQANGPFTGLYDFCDRVNLQQVPRGTIEALIKCGAFASTGGNRAQLLAVLDKAVETGAQAQQDRRLGQMSMFGQSSDAAAPRLHGALPDLPDMPNAELLKFEKELLGIYVTSHPLTERQSEIERYSSACSRDVARLSEGSEVTLGAMISEARRRVTKTGRSAGQQMAILTLEDLHGQIEVTIFADSLADLMKRRPDALAKESIVFVKGKVDKRREKPGLVAADIIPLADASGRLTTAVRLDLTHHAGPDILPSLKAALTRHKGSIPVYVQANTSDGRSVMMLLERECSVRPSAELVRELESLLGDGRVQLAGVKRRPRVQEQPLLIETEALPAAESAELLVPAAELEEQGIY